MLLFSNIFMKSEEAIVLTVGSDIDLNMKSLGYINHVEVSFICCDFYLYCYYYISNKNINTVIWKHTFMIQPEIAFDFSVVTSQLQLKVIYYPVTAFSQVTCTKSGIPHPIICLFNFYFFSKEKLLISVNSFLPIHPIS